jgi:hypothetical protein
VFVIPPICLDAKGGAKNGGKPKWLRLFCRPRTATVIPVYIISLLQFEKACFFLLCNFSKPHTFPSGVTNCMALYPASLFLKV